VTLRRSTIELCLAVAAVLVTAGPFLLGRGVDVPDDALYHAVANWEWLAWAWRSGVDPWFVPGKLGGISLAADVVPMGPHYPASWLLFVLPVSVALPVAALLHAIGILLAVRWLARVFGLGSTASTLAGAAVAAGPLGAITFVDCHLDVLPIYLWLPVAIGAAERLCRADENGSRRRWAALAAVALGLLLLGSHLRFAAAACASWGLWVVLRGMAWRWVCVVTAAALAVGAPGFVPSLLAVDLASDGVDRFVALSGPVHETYNGWNLAGWLAPKPFWMNRDFSLGAAAGLGFLLGPFALRGPVRRLWIFAALLLAAAASPSVPGLRYVFAPLLLLTHPIDLIYGALALIPAAVAGARGLELLWERGRLGRGATAALAVLAAAMVLRAAVPGASFADPVESRAWLWSIAQAAAVLAALGVGIRRIGGAPTRSAVVFGLALLDLALLGVRFHVAVPSVPLELTERARGADLDKLGSSYVDVADLAGLHRFHYDAEEMFDVVLESQAHAAGRVRRELDGRRWPLHVGPGHGVDALSGRAKMPERRTTELLMPLADALVREEGDIRHRLEHVDPAALEALFRPDALGGRILRLTGTEVAVDRRRVVGRVTDPLPDCWVPESWIAVPGEGEAALLAAWDAVVVGGQDPLVTAVLEAPIDLPARLPPGRVACRGRALQVESSAPTLVVLLRPWLTGWSLVDQGPAGRSPELFPVDAFHIGFLAPPGSSSFELRFEPPGLRPSRMAAGLGWLGLLLLAGRPRRQPSTGAPAGG